MANFTQLTSNLNIIQALSDLPNSSDGLTPSQLKAKFDEASGLIKLYINNTLIAELQAQGGAEKVGAVVGGVASNIQAFINAVESAGTGNLPPAGSVTNTMMATDVKVGSLSNLTTTEKGSLTGALNELVTAINSINTNLVPAGQIMYFATSSVPTGYLKANGAEVSRSTYSRLFTAIGTTYGVGNGSTTFNLPDLRGVFPRGWDDGRGYDSGRNIGTYQADDNKAHTHTGTTESAGSHTHSFTLASGSGTLFNGVIGGSTYNKTQTTDSAGAHTHTFTTDITGATESRPKNVALLACIKF